MNNQETYISYVIQSDNNHVHDFVITHLPRTQVAIYSDNTSQEVLKWSTEKQKSLMPNQKLVILNYFKISNYE